MLAFRSLSSTRFSRLINVDRRSSSDSSLIDGFGRKHNYLRLSLTERCNLRCRYCMPESGVTLTPRGECLSMEEIQRLTEIFVKNCSVEKVRLTGGEPTLDPKLIPLLNHLNNLRNFGLKTLAITTNGMTLANQCETYKKLGVNGINISLDTFRKDKFEFVTRRTGLDKTLLGLDKAIQTGFDDLKVNCVVIRGFNIDEICDFVNLAIKYPIEVRFIEFMPFSMNEWDASKLVNSHEIINIVKAHLGSDLQRLNSGPNYVSRLYKSAGMVGRIGFISSMSDNFCSGCNRLRLTADGHFKNCLFGSEETSLRDLMRNGANDYELVKAVRLSLSRKWKQHPPGRELVDKALRPMVKIASRNLHSGSTNHEDKDEGFDGFSHLDRFGKAKMVNVGHKPRSKRVALAEGRIFVGADTLKKINARTMPKGDLLSVSKVAGILGAKQTDKLIPLCHQIPLSCVSIEIVACESTASLLVRSQVETYHQTGVEMESLMAVSIALLTLYDMCKSTSKELRIADIRLVNKTK